MKKLIVFILSALLIGCADSREDIEQKAEIMAQKIVQAQQAAKIQNQIFEQEKRVRIDRKAVIENIIQNNNVFIEDFYYCNIKAKEKLVRALYQDMLCFEAKLRLSDSLDLAEFCKETGDLAIHWDVDQIVKSVAPDEPVDGDAGLIKGIENINKELNNIINKELVSETIKFFEMHPELEK